MAEKQNSKLNLNKFGPGLLLAATAIGVSHIVQSVQAGGKYGLILIGAIIFAHLIKYPFFLTSPKYSSHKKKSLLYGYFEIHPIFLILFLLLTIASMFSLQAVVTLIAAAVIENIFHFKIPIGQLSVAVLAICAAILFMGRYDFLDKMIKPIIIILFLATVVALGLVLFQEPNPNQISSNIQFNLTSKLDFLFLVAFLGWMPCPLDCATWNSVWSVKKQEELKEKYSFKESKLDFQVGYVVAAVLAVIFLALGNYIFYKNNLPLNNKAVPFIGDFLGIYTSQFGNFAFYIISIAVLMTMFSTVITCLDALPRVISKSLNILSNHYRKTEINEPKNYNYLLALLFSGTSILLLFFLTNMSQIIMVATLTSFISAAILATLHQIINIRLSREFPECKMSKLSIFYANSCVIFLIGISCLIVYNLFS